MSSGIKLGVGFCEVSLAKTCRASLMTNCENTMNYLRAFWIWCCLVAGMMFNAAVREVILIPAVGNLAAHIVSTILGVSLLFGITLLTLAWIGPKSLGDGWRLGATWLLLTIAFESLASYLIFGASWNPALGYHSLRGRIWVLMLCGQLFSPLLAIRVWRQSFLVNPEPEPHFLTMTDPQLIFRPAKLPRLSAE